MYMAARLASAKPPGTYQRGFGLVSVRIAEVGDARQQPFAFQDAQGLAACLPACPCSWLRLVMDGVGRPGCSVPSLICWRISAARRRYARGSAGFT